MIILGLTGGIATGKSTTSKYLREKYGFPIVDADVIARQVVEPGQPAYKSIVEHFSLKCPNLLLENGQLNREELGKQIFGNETERKYLNSVVHPAVRKAMVKQVIWCWITGHNVTILDVPLLFESKLDIFCGKTLLISCTDDLQLERLLSRDSHLTVDDAQKRIESQMNMELKRKLASTVIDNDGSLDDLRIELDKFVKNTKQNQVIYLLEWLIMPIGLAMAMVQLPINYMRRRGAKI